MTQTFATAQDYIDRIREELKDASKTNFPDDELIGYLNEAVDMLWKEIAAKAPWYFDFTSYMKLSTVTLVVATATYALPTDFYAVRYMDINGEEAANLKLLDESDDEADGYLLQLGKIKVFPTPTVAGTLRLWYIITPTVITVVTGVGSTVPLTSGFAQTIKEFVILKGKNRNDESAGGTQALFGLVRRSVGRLMTGMNAPHDRGWKVSGVSYY